MMKKISTTMVALIMVMMMVVPAFAATKANVNSKVIPDSAPYGALKFGTTGHDPAEDFTANTNSWLTFIYKGQAWVSVESVSIANPHRMMESECVFVPVQTFNGETEGYKFDFNKQQASHYMIKPDGTIDTSEGNIETYPQPIMKKGVNLYIPAASLLKALGQGGEEFTMSYNKAEKTVTIMVPDWSNPALNLLKMVDHVVDGKVVDSSATEYNTIPPSEEGNRYQDMWEVYKQQINQQ